MTQKHVLLFLKDREIDIKVSLKRHINKTIRNKNRNQTRSEIEIKVTTFKGDIKVNVF